MTRFYGIVGYANGTTMTEPGIYEEAFLEQSYYGDIIKRARNLVIGSDTVNPNITFSNQISILADAYALANFSEIRYIIMNDRAWSVTSVEIQDHRLLLTIGGKYNGVKDRAQSNTD